MKFSTKELNIFGGMLQIPISPAIADELGEYAKSLDKGKSLTVEIKKERRSLSANNFAWALMQRIAEKLGITKEEVYRNAIKEVGAFTPMPIKNEAVDSFIRIWQGNGIGYVVEVIGDSKLKGYTTIFAYHGSSAYDTKEMSRLIDCLVQDCKELGIETKPQEEIESLLREWECCLK